MLDLEALLAPIEGDAPSGPDLEYDPEWQELDRLAQGKPEQQFGDTIIPAEEPDWRDVGDRAQNLFKRTKDVRAAVLLARAQTHLEQFTGLCLGLQLILQLMERYWDTVHPQLDATDNDDPTMRLNALSALADPQGLLRNARNARLFQSRAHGELGVRQIELAAGKLQPRSNEEVTPMATVEQQLAAVIREDTDLPARVSATLASARGISRLLDDKVGSDRSPDLKALIAALLTVDQVVGRVAATVQGAASGAASEDAGVDASGAGGGMAINTSGAIRSRSDVIALLDRVSEYLARAEPTNPARLLVERAKKIMDMDFIQLMTELAPDGLSQARIVTGVPEEPS